MTLFCMINLAMTHEIKRKKSCFIHTEYSKNKKENKKEINFLYMPYLPKQNTTIHIYMPLP